MKLSREEVLSRGKDFEKRLRASLVVTINVASGEYSVGNSVFDSILALGPSVQTYSFRIGGDGSVYRSRSPGRSGK